MMTRPKPLLPKPLTTDAKTTDAKMKDRIERVMSKLPALGRYGFRDLSMPAEIFAMQRAGMLRPEGLAEFSRARTWLSNYAMQDTLNLEFTTNELVHQARVETRWNYSNGMMIAAAYSLGFDVSRASDGTGAYLNIGERVEPRRHMLRYPAPAAESRHA